MAISINRFLELHNKYGSQEEVKRVNDKHWDTCPECRAVKPCATYEQLQRDLTDARSVSKKVWDIQQKMDVARGR